MRQGRLPDGFGVRIDPSVRAYSGGRVLIGGSPTRMLKLAPSAAAMIGDGFLEVTDPHTAVVARRLLDSGVANPRPMLLPSTDDVTVIVPLRNNAGGLQRLLAALRGHHVIVVDDGSDIPVEVPAGYGGQCNVTVLRHDASRGPAAARNSGLRSATTEFVAFLDSDVVPRNGWLEVMLGHFSDPAVALVAPRIVALDSDSNQLARYEHSRSSLDLGRREAAVRAHGPVSYVPSAAMLVRRRVLLDEGGFDETMHVGEDVDVCWRLEQAGWRLRYEPAAQVAHDHRVSFGEWFQRKMFYGTGAAPLAARHEGKVAPLAISPWTVAAVVLMATLTRLGLLGAIAAMSITMLKLRKIFTELDQPTRVAAIYVAQGFMAGLWQLASAMCRHYWPITVLAMIFSSRIRQIAIAMALAEGVADWLKHKETGGLGPVTYTAYKRIDDVAYGAGLWQGAVRARSVEALKPTLGR
ncbi:mycofactocin biosynthesis glycosyltransferase MftF [Antrihabitans cavernicola]|uniref:Mycofactocin system glycosyltransferase n=1 Tax=Antrihabitans cavernicola TaxID=2495913 RepID=A0A5A7S4J2_9NOCA|nr:mycofactocin biosynthesis glycosyltransferase MftF [Spelaeibacter cavernicola]KAA0018387.1 mycofactocin system glycosyltransferase [Spelaeibacter cavernicola]